MIYSIMKQASIPDFPCSELDWFCCLDAMGLRPVDQRRTYFPIATFINSRCSAASYVERVEIRVVGGFVFKKTFSENQI